MDRATVSRAAARTSRTGGAVGPGSRRQRAGRPQENAVVPVILADCDRLVEQRRAQPRPRAGCHAHGFAWAWAASCSFKTDDHERRQHTIPWNPFQGQQKPPGAMGAMGAMPTALRGHGLHRAVSEQTITKDASTQYHGTHSRDSKNRAHAHAKPWAWHHMAPLAPGTSPRPHRHES
jgi:hypothetical protein